MKKILSFFVILLFSLLLYAGFNPKKQSTGIEYENWKKQYEKDWSINKSFQAKVLSNDFSFIELELVEVSAGEKYFSLWGHVMLLFKGSGKGNPNEDLALSFLADFDDFPVNDLKASTGGYIVRPVLNTIEHFRLDYVLKENRKMTFHTLKVDQKGKILILKILRQWILNPKAPGGYSFFYNNCVSLMVKLMSEANIIEPGLYGYWPKYVANQFIKKGIIK